MFFHLHENDTTKTNKCPTLYSTDMMLELNHKCKQLYSHDAAASKKTKCVSKHPRVLV